jgi:ATP-dependent Clp protease adaptor protein ClpS
MTELTVVEPGVTVAKPKAKYKLKKPSNFAVILHNDDYTPMDFVVWVLIKIFNKTEDIAQNITKEVHTKGIGVAGVFHFEIAEQKATDAALAARQNEYPLQVTVEEVGA